MMNVMRRFVGLDALTSDSFQRRVPRSLGARAESARHAATAPFLRVGSRGNLSFFPIFVRNASCVSSCL